MCGFRWNHSFALFALLCLMGDPVGAQSGAIRGYPAGTALQQTPYYSAYYPVQYGYAYTPAVSYSGVPQTAYYAPSQPGTYAAARPTAGYTLSPAGGANSGAEAYAYYGQSTPLNYVPPTYYGYQTRVVQVPVTYYRPYTVYQGAQPTTCQRPTTGTQCQTQRFRLFSCCDWLFGNRNCAGGSCSAPAPQTCYSGTCAPPAAAVPATGCGTPYYNTIPPATTVPTIPGTRTIPGTTTTPPAGTRGIFPPTTVPPPGTRIINPGTATPGVIRDGADVTPRIPSGTTVPSPGSTFPGTSGSGALGPSGASYRPADQGTPAIRNEAVAQSAQNRREASPYAGGAIDRSAVREPSLGPRRSVKPVPDPHGTERLDRNQPANRAPQLLDPNDRTAAMPSRQQENAKWGVVPATWPERPTTRTETTKRSGLRTASQHIPSLEMQTWDDTQWKSAAP